MKKYATQKNNAKKVYFAWKCLILFAGFLYTLEVFSAPNPYDFLNPTFNESLTYDDNLYKVGSRKQLGQGSEMADFINKASARLNVHETFGRQIIDVNLEVDDNHYFYNNSLNHISTNDGVVLKWLVTDKFSGKLGVGFTRALAGFANTQFLSADILTTPSYYLDSSYRLNSHWRFEAGWKGSNTLHSATSRANQNTDSQIMHAGITFLTASENSVGIDYSLNNSQFPKRTLSNSADTAFQENIAKILMNYHYSAKLGFESYVGYKMRRFEHLSFMDFEGEIWRISVTYRPTVKTSLVLSGWHEPTSFVELASNYYVSEGFSIAPSWFITEKLMLSGQLRIESQSHSGNASSVVTSNVALRNDELYSTGVNANYNISSSANLGLAYQFNQRSSNREISNYLDNSLTATVQFKF